MLIGFSVFYGGPYLARRYRPRQWRNLKEIARKKVGSLPRVDVVVWCTLPLVDGTRKARHSILVGSHRRDRGRRDGSGGRDEDAGAALAEHKRAGASQLPSRRA